MVFLVALKLFVVEVPPRHCLESIVMIIPSIRSLGSYTKVIVGKPECLVLESLLLCGKLFTHAEFPSILVLHVIVPSHAFSLLYGRVLIRM